MMNSRGSVLLEVLIAAALACAICTVLFQLAVGAQAAVVAQGDAADQQQRLRVVTEAIRQDLIMAGAGPSRGTASGSLNRVLPPIVPARIGTMSPDPELTARSDRLSIVSVPDGRAQAVLRSAMATRASPLAIDGSPVCAAATACGFAVGDRAIVYDPATEGGPYEFLTIGAVDTGRDLLMPATPLNHAYPAGARVALVTIRVYHVDSVGRRLMIYDGDRSDLPLIDRIVNMRVTYLADLGGPAPMPLTLEQLADGPVAGEVPNRFDADLLRVRRVRISLTLQDESAAAIRDLATTIDVAPPNLDRR